MGKRGWLATARTAGAGRKHFSAITHSADAAAVDARADDFIAKWQGVTASELSTSQSFLIDLCHLLGVDTPHPRPDRTTCSSVRSPSAASINAPAAEDDAAPTVVAPAKPQAWTKDTIEQVRTVADLLATRPIPLTLDDIAVRFTARGPWKRRLPQLLDMLVALGRATTQDDRYSGAA